MTKSDFMLKAPWFG